MMNSYSAIGESLSYNFFRPVEKVFLEDEAVATSACATVESVALCLPGIFQNVGIIKSSLRNLAAPLMGIERFRADTVEYDQ